MLEDSGVAFIMGWTCGLALAGLLLLWVILRDTKDQEEMEFIYDEDHPSWLEVDKEALKKGIIKHVGED